MSQYLLTISDNRAASSFLDFVKNLDFILKVEQVEESFEPLSKEDWIKPGRPATDEEFEQLAIAMEQDIGGYDPETTLEMTLKEIREWRKEKSR